MYLLIVLQEPVDHVDIEETLEYGGTESLKFFGAKQGLLEAIEDVEDKDCVLALEIDLSKALKYDFPPSAKRVLLPVRNT